LDKKAMIQKKPAFEKINTGPDNSVFVHQHSEQRANMPFWHFHPELELVYVDKGQGKRHIGSHLSYFHNSQLLLIGANLPHHGFSDRLTTRGSETIVQFKPDFLGDTFLNMPEMKSIAGLFERAKKGVLFKPEIRKEIGPRIKDMVNYQGFERILKLLEILHDLSLSREYTLLNVDGFAFETTLQDSNRIDVIYKHINQNFERTIPLGEISDLASMTVPAFCRYFKKSTGKTFTRFVNEYRIVQARRLLTETTHSITDICYECGFNNFSHFNKLFKEFTGKSASQYRSELKRFVQ
jgi:AraC-like DNA-binding protein